VFLLSPEAFPRKINQTSFGGNVEKYRSAALPPGTLKPDNFVLNKNVLSTFENIRQFL
jgi:hypothetical protein